MKPGDEASQIADPINIMIVVIVESTFVAVKIVTTGIHELVWTLTRTVMHGWIIRAVTCTHYTRQSFIRG